MIAGLSPAFPFSKVEIWLHRVSSEATTPFLIGLAISEPQSGCDNMSPNPDAGILTTAKLAGEEYILNGSKSYITNAGIAGLCIVWARTDKSKGASQGASTPCKNPLFLSCRKERYLL